MNVPKIAYWISTGFVSLLMLFSAGMYILNNAEVQTVFQNLGYPAQLIYPLAIAKILAVVAILTKKSQTLKEWAYAGLFFDFVLAIQAHVVANDGEFYAAAVALILLMTSYFTEEKAFSRKEDVMA